MNAESFKDEVLSNYLDNQKLVSILFNPPNLSTGNGILFTGIFYYILAVNKLIDSKDIERFSKAIKNCYVINNHGQCLGLLNRNPGRLDLEAQDDYIGAALASSVVDKTICRHIELYGSVNNWSYDNQRPFQFSLRCWHQRFPGLVGFYKICAYGDYNLNIFDPNLFDTFSIFIKLLLPISMDASDVILDWLMTRAFKRRWIFKYLVKYWEYRFLKIYGEVNRVMKIYYGESHPFSRVKMDIDGVVITD